MRRHRSRVSNLAAGAIAAVVILAVCYLVFGGSLPFSGSGFVLRAAFTVETQLHLGSPVRIAGVELTELGDRELTQLRRDRIGFIFQTFNLLPVLNAEENILLPLSIAGRKPDRDWFERLIDAVGIRDRLTHRPAEMSGGQQQRVAVARALVSRPAVVFADEPSGNLDSKSSNDVLELLRHAVDDFSQTVVMVTHDAHAASFADRLIVLGDGRIVHDGDAVTAGQALDLMKSVG